MATSVGAPIPKNINMKIPVLNDIYDNIALV